MSGKVTRAIVLAMVVLLTALVSAPALARHEMPIIGNAGSPGKTECPPGQEIVGFSGRSGTLVVRIQLICATPQANGSFSQGIATGTEYGGAVGTREDSYCRDAEITRFGVIPGQKGVTSITMACHSRVTGEETIISFGDHNFQADCISYGGTCPGSAASVTFCPGEVPIGINVRAGIYVAAFGLICGRVVDAAPAAAAPVAPAAAATAPVAPHRSIIPVESAAPIGTAADLAGKWSVTTVQNAHYILTLTVDGDSASGVLTNTQNGIYNGTLTGTVTGGRIAFKWSQPANGSAECANRPPASAASKLTTVGSQEIARTFQ